MIFKRTYKIRYLVGSYCFGVACLAAGYWVGLVGEDLVNVHEGTLHIALVLVLLTIGTGRGRSRWVLFISDLTAILGWAVFGSSGLALLLMAWRGV